MELARFLGGRALSLAGTLLVASVVVFGSLYLAPGSPLAFLTGGRSLSPEAIASITRQYGLDQPLPVRYIDWLGGLLHGDLGQSIVYHQSVGSLLGPRIATTFLLLACATLLIVLLGVGSGFAAGVRGGRVDAAISVLSSVGLAVPAFVAAIVLIAVFAAGLGWFPVLGPGDGLGDRLWHLTLPAVALALSSIAFVSRITRFATREELGSDHVEAALIRGIPRRTVLRRHVARNALVPVSTVVGLTSASLIAGSVVVDQAFALNGLGSSLISAVTDHDYPVVQAITLLMVLAFVLVNTVVDIAYPWIDPRITLGARP